MSESYAKDKDVSVKVRVSSSKKKQMDERAKRKGFTLSQYLRYVIDKDLMGK